MKYCILIIGLLLSLSVRTQTTDDEESIDTKRESEINSAEPVYAPELGGYYQWNYENHSQIQTSLNGIYNQYFLLNHSLKSQGQDLSQLQNNQELSNLINSSLNTYPNTFETNFMQYIHSGENIASAEFLLNAYQLDATRAEIYDELLEYSDWTSNESLSKQVAGKIKSSNKYDQAIYDYSNRMLSSLPEKAYLITSGELETITSKVIQLVEGKYRGITVIRKDWLEEDRYSKNKLEELGLIMSDLTGDLQPSIQNLITSNPGKDFYLSLTLPITEFNYMLDRLYLTGLSYRYSERPITNLISISDNWNEYLQISNQLYESSPWAKKLVSNYLPSGIKLYHYYLDAGNKSKAKKIKTKLIEIGRICNKEDLVKATL